MIKLILKDGAKIPKYSTPGSSGRDVRAMSILKIFNGDREVPQAHLEFARENFITKGYIEMKPLERILFGTGLVVAYMPSDIEIQVRPRSGMSLKRGINASFGTIDSDYRGEIGVILTNNTSGLNTISHEDRIAQIVSSEITRHTFSEAFTVIDTERGEGGFGSTGK